MEIEEIKSTSEVKEKIIQIFSNFMLSTSKLEELATAGSRLLVDFQQGLEFIRRPSIERTSKIVENIIKVNETKRLLSYIEGGCINPYDNVRNLNKLNKSQVQLRNNLTEARCIVNELESLVQDVRIVIETASENFLPTSPEDNGLEIEEMSCDDEAAKYCALMAIIYTMVKQDYNMQEKIVSSLNLKSSSEELQSYCMMWSLRPFVDDDFIIQSWKLIP